MMPSSLPLVMHRRHAQLLQDPRCHQLGLDATSAQRPGRVYAYLGAQGLLFFKFSQPDLASAKSFCRCSFRDKSLNFKVYFDIETNDNNALAEVSAKISSFSLQVRFLEYLARSLLLAR